MASIRKTKKDAVYATSDLIEAIQISYLLKSSDEKTAQGIIDETIDAFDLFIEKINKEKRSKNRAGIKATVNTFEEKSNAIAEKINTL